jgi:SAM-dependent methyltransferase
VPEALSCEGCRASYPLVDSIPCFSDPNTYWGEEFSLDEMRAINDLARSRCWRTAVEELVAPKSPSRARYISDFSRADWRFLFPMQSGWKVLDVGAGWGSLSAILATLCGQVAALESSLERARFIQARIEQDRLDNLVAVHGDLSHPPLRPNTFDLVALNGVLEWLGWADTSRNTRTVQIELLRNARRLLKPEGWLYIGIENRFGISYWLGAMDHSYLKYTSLMPRPLAHAVTRLAKGHTYRTYTYSPIGYRRLLEQAGYRDIQFYGVMPSYSRPINYWPLAEGAPLQRFAQVLFSDKPNNLSLKSRIAQWAVERSPASLVAWAAQWMAPHLLISARKGESRAGMD